jgi:hypothetical protein
MFSPVKILLNPKLKKTTNFLVTFAFVLEKLILAFSCLSFVQSVHMHQLGSHWEDFSEIWYWGYYIKI